MYKYRFRTYDNQILAFESNYHITALNPVIFPDATFIRFEDVEVVVKLTDMKEVEINGVNHQLRSYATR